MGPPLAELAREKTLCAGIGGAEIRLYLQQRLVCVALGEQGGQVVSLPEEPLRRAAYARGGCTARKRQVGLPRGG